MIFQIRLDPFVIQSHIAHCFSFITIACDSNKICIFLKNICFSYLIVIFPCRADYVFSLLYSLYSGRCLILTELDKSAGWMSEWTQSVMEPRLLTCLPGVFGKYVGLEVHVLMEWNLVSGDGEMDGTVSLEDECRESCVYIMAIFMCKLKDLNFVLSLVYIYNKLII